MFKTPNYIWMAYCRALRVIDGTGRQRSEDRIRSLMGSYLEAGQVPEYFRDCWLDMRHRDDPIKISVFNFTRFYEKEARFALRQVLKEEEWILW